MARIAWGAKVSTLFLDRLAWIVRDLSIGASEADGMCITMACIGWESGRTFDSNVLNKAGSGATGLIQFMPKTAIALGTTVDKLAKMTPEDQLNYVWKYFAPYKGKLKTLGDMYMAILWPKGVGQPDSYVLWDKHESPTTYLQNAGLDIDHNGVIIKAEAVAKVGAVLIEGMSDANSVEYAATTIKHDTVTDHIMPEVAAMIEKQAEKAVVTAAETGIDVAAGVVLPAAINSAVEANLPAITKYPTADGSATVTVVAEPNTRANIFKRALSGWQGNLAGVTTILGALLLDPAFREAAVNLFAGHGGAGAVVALIGAGLIAYKRTVV